MKVLLINPPREIPQRSNFPTLGLGYLGSYLKKAGGHDVRIADAVAMSWAQLESAMSEFAADVVGITCWTLERGQAFRTGEMARRKLPGAKIVLGGPHATAYPGHMFEAASADFVALGEGEYTFAKMLEGMENSGGFGGVPGLAYKEDGRVVINERGGPILDLDSLPFPMYDFFDLKDYNGVPEVSGPAAAVFTSRGCPYNCIFCASIQFMGRRWRARSPENVLAELEWLKRERGIVAGQFYDDSFSVDKKRVLAICSMMIEKNIGIKWVSQTRVNLVDREMLEWMKRAGCFKVEFGVESGSQKILDTIGKSVKIEDIRRAFSLCREVGLLAKASLMVGNPGEDRNTIRDTVRLMREIKAYDIMGANILWILPGTEIHALAEEKGIITEEFWKKPDPPVLYYTGEYAVPQLQALRNRLYLGLALSHNPVRGMILYLYRRLYNRYPFFQRLYHGRLSKLKSVVRWMKSE